MTIETLRDVLTSRPRRRVAKIVLLWCAVAILKPIKWMLKIPAYPFIWIANLIYDCSQCLFGDIGDIQGEIAERLYNEGSENDDDDASDI